MFLSLLRLNAESVYVQRDLRDPHDLHRTIMRGFPPIIDPALQARAYWGVLHRLELIRRTGQVLVYVQSKIEPDWNALPDSYLKYDGMENPAVKSVATTFASITVGRTLRFRLRANPTRKIETKSGPDGSRRHGRRVPLSDPQTQVEWLARKGQQHGFGLVHVTIAGSGAAEYISSTRTGRTFQGVLYEGQIQVQDAERFRSALSEGIGPAKAFGFGLLSIGPA